MNNTSFSLTPHTNQTNSNYHYVDNSITNDYTDFDACINQMLHSNDDDGYYYCDNNHDQFVYDSPHDDLVDPMFLMCNEILEDPLMEELFSDVTSPVQINGNNRNNDTAIMHYNDDVYHRQEQHNICSPQRDEKPGIGIGIDEALPLRMWDKSLDFDNSCSSCQVLREIGHTNGTHTTKLELHGVIGVIYHAILLNYHAVDSNIFDSQMIDFSTMSDEMVKEYLKNYLREQKEKDFTLLPESISSFYETLCIGYEWSSPKLNNPHDARKPTVVVEPVVQWNQGETSHRVTEDSLVHHDARSKAKGKPLVVNQEKPNPFKLDLSAQRERTKNLALVDFSQYFDQPVKHAAKELLLCDTVVKKKLRSFGVPRWPYRKVKSIKRRISELSKNLEENNEELRLQAMIEINRLQQQIQEILRGNIDVIRNILL